MKPIASWTHQKKTPINRLQEQIAYLNKRSTEVQSCLPEEWRDYCQVVRVDIDQQLLILSTTEQNLVTSLRYLERQLIGQLKKKFDAFRKIEKMKCIYSPQIVAIQKTRAPFLSKEAAMACSLAAKKCAPALKESLEKLSETLILKKER